MHTAFLWRLGATNKITFQIMSKDELHSLCDWHMEYLLILDIGTNESGILDLCVHDSRGKRFFVKSLRMLEESIGLSPVMENVMRWKIPAVCLHKKGFREPRSCLRGVYRWDFMTAKGGWGQMKGHSHSSHLCRQYRALILFFKSQRGEAQTVFRSLQESNFTLQPGESDSMLGKTCPQNVSRRERVFSLQATQHLSEPGKKQLFWPKNDALPSQAWTCLIHGSSKTNVVPMTTS